MICAPPVDTFDKVLALFSDSSCSPYSDLLITNVCTTLGTILSMILTIAHTPKIIKIITIPLEKSHENIPVNIS